MKYWDTSTFNSQLKPCNRLQALVRNLVVDKISEELEEPACDIHM